MLAEATRHVPDADLTMVSRAAAARGRGQDLGTVAEGQRGDLRRVAGPVLLGARVQVFHHHQAAASVGKEACVRPPDHVGPPIPAVANDSLQTQPLTAGGRQGSALGRVGAAAGPGRCEGLVGSRAGGAWGPRILGVAGAIATFGRPGTNAQPWWGCLRWLGDLLPGELAGPGRSIL